MGARGRWAAAVGLVALATGAAAAVGLRATLDRLTATALESALGAGTVARLDEVRLSLLPPEVSGTLTLARTADDGVSGWIALSGVLALQLGWNGVTLSPPGCLTLRAETLALNRNPLTVGPGGTLCAFDGHPLMRWSANGLELTARLALPSVAAPAMALRADAVTVSLQGDAVRSLTIDATAMAVRHTVPSPGLAPLSLAARAMREGGAVPWSLSATVSGAGGGLVIRANGTHDPRSGVGRLDLRSDPLRIGEAGVAVAALSPRLDTVLRAVSGRLTGRAGLAWQAGVVRSTGALRIEAGGATLGPVRVAGVNGVVALSSLWPPVVPDGQRLAVALLDVGVPLTDGVIRFGYGRDRRVDVDEARWRWGGGTLKADPFELSPTAPKGLVTLHADGVDLGELLGLIRVDGVSASGRLSGSLPVRIGEGGVRLEGAVFDGTQPGTLRYAPAEPPPGLSGPEGSPTQLLLGALSDFRYDSLRLTLDGEAGGELRAGLSVRGTNPAFYDGHPVALTLTLSGALDRILRQSLDAYRIPEVVRDRMIGFDQPKDP